MFYSGQSPWVPGSVPQGQCFSLHFSFVTPVLCLSSLRWSRAEEWARRPSSAGWRPSSHVTRKTPVWLCQVFHTLHSSAKCPFMSWFWWMRALLGDWLSVPVWSWFHDHTCKDYWWGRQWNNSSHCFSSPWRSALLGKGALQFINNNN